MAEWKNIPSDISKYHGFIYKIVHKPTGKYYIGRKTFWNLNKKKPLKFLREDGKCIKDKKGNKIPTNRKSKKHTIIESDWKTYWGSSNNLLEDIEKYGEEQFEREMIRYCESKWDEAYYEAKIQFEYDVLNDKNCYNGIINCRINRFKEGHYNRLG